MLQFLSSLFSPADERHADLDDAMVDAAIDRVVEGTDKRLKGLGNYRRQLRTPVATSLLHVMELVDALPPAIEISRKTFGSEPRLHAFFTSINELQDKIGASRGVDAYLEQAGRTRPDNIYGLLSVQWKEVTRLGSVLQDDTIQREVRQIAVNFFNHDYLGASGSLEDTKQNVEQRIFDFIIQIAMERIIAERSKRSELEAQKVLLRRKLSAMKDGNWGLEEMLRPEMSGTHDLVALSAEIESVDKELSKLGASHEVLERNMRIIEDTLGQPQDVMTWRDISMTLDRMNIKVDGTASTNVYQLELLEVYSGIGAARVLLPGWYPASELPRKRGYSNAEAAPYLNR